MLVESWRHLEEHMDVAAAVYAQPTQTGDAAV
jgi:hypothetical protein